jgi:hypothetical protein
MKYMNCWICGERLYVAPFRDYPRSDGQNTIDANIRTCDKCWAKIVRKNVSKSDIGKHLAALR